MFHEFKQTTESVLVYSKSVRKSSKIIKNLLAVSVRAAKQFRIVRNIFSTSYGLQMAEKAK